MSVTEVIHVCLGANCLLGWAPGPVQITTAAPDASPSTARTWLLFVRFNKNFPRSFLALQSHPLLNLNPTQAPTLLPSGLAGGRAVGGSPRQPRLPHSSCNSDSSSSFL